MAIIKPSRKFVGSDLKTSNASRYIKEAVKVVSFAAKENKEGLYLYILPAYKLDATGSGVWFKTVQIRDNFGDKFKEKYAVSPHYPDPVAHFERNYKLHFPDLAKVEEEEVEGQKRKKYPPYGRIARRVLFNVALAQKLEAGPQILDLPAFGGASQIMEWQESRDKLGRERPLINDPENACSVYVKLKEKATGNPWQVIVDANDRIPLPENLADSDIIYNLDDILEYKTKEELIDKLQSMFSPDVFDLCMQGYDLTGSSESPIQTTRSVRDASATVRPVQKPVPTVAPGLQFEDKSEGDEIPMEYVEDEEPSAPAAVSKPKLSAEGAAAFLRKKG